LPLSRVGLGRALHRALDPRENVDQDERGNAERRALFVGLWPPMFWLIGDTIERCERRRLPWRR